MNNKRKISALSAEINLNYSLLIIHHSSFIIFLILRCYAL